MGAKICILEITLHLPQSQCLKDKRIVLSSLKHRIRSNFNVSIIESDSQDKWQRVSLTVVNAGMNNSLVNSTLSKVINFLERNPRIQIIDHHLELI